METKNLLLIIDMQNDFCSPDGSLFVDGAGQDVKHLTEFIQKNVLQLNEIVLTQDYHHVMDISHPMFWCDEEGKSPEPFTVISLEDVKTRKWTPKVNTEEALEYIQNLDKQGEFPHIIWPEHCIVGSTGAAIVDDIMNVVTDWARTGNYFEVLQKGINPLTEHFGALRANVPVSSDASTQLNTGLVEKMKNSRNIIVAGEAKSHCVANTVKQICEIEGLAEKLILLDDCMSNVTGFESIADSIYENAINKGARVETTETITLN